MKRNFIHPKIRKALALIRDVVVSLFCVWWLFFGFFHFFLYPLIALTFGFRPWNTNLIWLNWAYLYNFYTLFFTVESVPDVDHIPPPLTQAGWITMIGISFLVTVWVAQQSYRIGRSVVKVAIKDSDVPVGGVAQ